ncbi:hypothetical protein C0993_005301 [Termitomyces sp. T159_Od127]|nr:hypothetical protein C0993_005301 [Termitomyces sp. T159_Od127]
MTRYPKPTPTAVEIPSWAYLDISKTNWTFNATVAAESAGEINFLTDKLFVYEWTASEVPQSSTLNQPGTTSTGSNPASTETQPSESAATNEKTSHAGSIAGGVVGGLAGIALIALAVFWFFLKSDSVWKNQRKNHQRIDLDAEGLQPSSMGDASKDHAVSQSMSNVHRAGPLSNTSLLQQPQSTGDAFTPVTSSMFTTLSVRNSMESLPFSGSQITRGAYSGVAEI